MDNLPARKAAGVRDVIEAAGASLPYLPPYSSDFNPIENSFAKLKALLRAKVGSRSGRSSTCSPQPYAQTTSKHPDMTRIKQDVL